MSPLASRSSDPATGVHGPCERCGVVFTSQMTSCQPICPNCGHRDPDVGPKATKAGLDRVGRVDESGLRLSLRQSPTPPVEVGLDGKAHRWRLN